MSIIIKMMDKDNTGFRLVSVIEPVDLHVLPYDKVKPSKPCIIVRHGLTALNKTYDLEGNAYIMNEAGDTISKIDFKDVSIGMPEGLAFPGAVIEDSMKGASLTTSIHPVRELGAVHIDDSEDRDCGVLLKRWDAEGSSLGGYFDGYFKGLPCITSVMIRQFKAYAKPEIIEEIRKTGEWPETKLAMLKANNDLVDPPLTTVTLKENGEIDIASEGQIKLHSPLLPSLEASWRKLTSHLGVDTAVLLSNTLCTYVIDKGRPVYGCVNGQNLKYTRVIVDGKVVLACTGNTAFPSDAQSFKIEGLQKAWEELSTDYQWFEFTPTGDTRTVDTFEIRPTGDFNDLVEGKPIANPSKVI